ncbi:MAG: hypothetical protein V7603_4878 [Micromonosporaceae bacterium]
MRVALDPDPASFLARTWKFLDRDPVQHNVIRTAAQARIAGDVPLEEDALWLRVHDDGVLAGAAISTPPRGAALSAMPRAAAEAIADWAAVHRPDLPTADGPGAPAAAFARRYAGLLGGQVRGGLAQTMLRVDRVEHPRGVPGRMREALPEDLDLVVDWQRDFSAQVLRHHGGDADPTEPLQHRIAAGGLVWLWEVDGRPVSVAWQSRLPKPDDGRAATVPATRVVRVSGVYTPAGHRGHGYASANVAAISQRALDGGATTCMLYADKANPTSNKIYQAIGYRPVGESQEWLLVRPA